MELNSQWLRDSAQKLGSYHISFESDEFRLNFLEVVLQCCSYFTIFYGTLILISRFCKPHVSESKVSGS